LDIVLTKTHLITGHADGIYQLEEFFKRLEENEKNRLLYMDQSPAYLLYNLIEILLDSCFPKLDHIHEKLINIENQVFNGKEKEMVFEISVVKRDIQNFRRTLKPQRSVIESLVQTSSPIVPERLKPYLQDLVGTNIRLWNALESNKETIESMEETNNSLLSNKLDHTMKVLTIFNAIFLPVTVYSNVMSMSTHVPLSQSPGGFWIHVTSMLTISIFTLVLFRAKKWL